MRMARVAIETSLIDEALKLGGEKTKKAAVTQALAEYIQRRKQQKVFELFGKIDYWDDVDHKARRKPS
jgi:hypothetical protein